MVVLSWESIFHLFRLAKIGKQMQNLENGAKDDIRREQD